MINDVIDCFDDKVNCKLYADDVKLYTELRSAADTYFFQDCLDRIYQWSLSWQLQISSQKCCVIDVGKSTAADDGYPCCLGNERLTVSENVRDLGVVVDSQFTGASPLKIPTYWSKLSKFTSVQY